MLSQNPIICVVIGPNMRRLCVIGKNEIRLAATGQYEISCNWSNVRRRA